MASKQIASFAQSPVPQYSLANLSQDNTDYSGYCEKFVERYTYQQDGIFPTAADAWDNYAASGKGLTDLQNMQPGDTLYFAPDASNNYAGHTALYLGNGKMISATYNGVQVTDVNAWMQETGQKPLGYISKANYGNVPIPQSLPSQYTQASQNQAATGNNDTSYQFQDAPAAIQDTQGLNATQSTYTVQPGDTLYGIAQRLLGDGNKWQQLQGYTGDPRQLPIGTQITANGGQIDPNKSILQQVLPKPVKDLNLPTTTNNSSLKGIQLAPLAPAGKTGKQQNVAGVTNPGANGPAINPQNPQGIDSKIFGTPSLSRALNPFQGAEDTINTVGNMVGGVQKAFASGQNNQTPAPASSNQPQANPLADFGTTVNNAVQRPFGTLGGPTYGQIGNAVMGAAKTVGNMFQPKPAIGTGFTLPPSADHLVNPVMNRQFSSNMRTLQPSQNSRPSASFSQPTQPNYFVSSTGRVIQNAANTINQPKQRAPIQQPIQRAIGQGVNEFGSAINQGVHAAENFGGQAMNAVGNAAKGAMSWLAGLGGPMN